MKEQTKTLTHDKPLHAIIRFTLPLLVGNIFQQFYNMADALIVGRTIGTNALASIGCTGHLGYFVIGLAQGMTSGFAVITAQKYGAADNKGVRNSFITGMLLSICVSVVLTISSAPLVQNSLLLMNTPIELLDNAVTYLRIILWGIICTMLYNYLANVIRALGDSRTPLLFLIAACIVNIILDYALILWCGMGVEGAAIATIMSQLLASLLCLIYIFRRMPILVRGINVKSITKNECILLLRLGVPMGIQNSLLSIGGIFLQSAMNTLGTAAVAASTAAGKIDQFAAMPLSSIGLSSATFTAQNHGAGKHDRVIKGMKQCVVLNTVYSFIMCAVMILFGRVLVSPFLNETAGDILNLARMGLVVNGIFYFLLGFVLVARGFLQGMGLNKAPMLAVIIELAIRIVASFVLVRHLGYLGVCLTAPLAWLGSFIPLALTVHQTIHEMRKQEFR